MADLHFRCDPKIRTHLLKLAKLKRWTLSQAVRVAVEEYVEREKEKKVTQEYVNDRLRP